MGQDARLGADPLAWLKSPDAKPASGRSRIQHTTLPGRPGPAGQEPPDAEPAPGEPTPAAAPESSWAAEILTRCPAPLLVLDQTGSLLLANQAFADLAGLELDELTDADPAAPLFLAPGPAGLADLAAMDRSAPLRLRPLTPRGAGPALAADIQTAPGPDDHVLAVFFAPDPEAEEADPGGMEEILGAVRGAEPPAEPADKAASQLLRSRVLFKSWLLRRPELLRSRTLAPEQMEDALRGCAVELPGLLKLPADALRLEDVRVHGSLPWSRALFLAHFFFDLAAASLRRRKDKTGGLWTVSLDADQAGAVLLSLREEPPALLRKLKMDPEAKGPMAWLARRVLRHGGMLAVDSGEGVELSVKLP
jgi:hypothetical protein